MLGITFSGRFNRRQYWLGILGLFVLLFVTFALGLKIASNSVSTYTANYNNTTLQSENTTSVNTVATSTLNRGLPSKKSNNLLVLIFFVFFLYCLLYSLSITIRRGHDLDLSGWVTFLVLLVPIVDFFFAFLYLGLFRGDQQANKYGPIPN